MGGHAGGEIASQVCIKEIASHIQKHHKLFENVKIESHPNIKISTTLADSVNYASTKIYERALEEPSLKGMGTTATLIKIIDNFAYCAHVGDSRFYLIRSGFIYQISNDHSLVSEQVRAGLLTKEEAESHHLKNVVTRSVGYQEEEEVDTIFTPLENNDILLLCSDGLHGKISAKEISQITNKQKFKSVDTLIDKANENGGEDNITVIVLIVKKQ